MAGGTAVPAGHQCRYGGGTGTGWSCRLPAPGGTARANQHDDDVNDVGTGAVDHIDVDHDDDDGTDSSA